MFLKTDLFIEKFEWNYGSGNDEWNDLYSVQSLIAVGFNRRKKGLILF